MASSRHAPSSQELASLHAPRLSASACVTGSEPHLEEGVDVRQSRLCLCRQQVRQQRQAHALRGGVDKDDARAQARPRLHACRPLVAGQLLCAGTCALNAYNLVESWEGWHPGRRTVPDVHSQDTLGGPQLPWYLGNANMPVLKSRISGHPKQGPYPYGKDPGMACLAMRRHSQEQVSMNLSLTSKAHPLLIQHCAPLQQQQACSQNN